MAITYLGAGPIAAARSDSNTVELRPALANGVQANDVGFVTVFTRSATAACTIHDWIEIAKWDHAGGRHWVFARRLSGEQDDPVVIRTDTLGDFYAHARVYRGCTTYRNAWEVVSSPSMGTVNPAVLSEIKTLSDNAMVISLLMGHDNAPVNSLNSASGTDPVGYSTAYIETGVGVGFASAKADALKTNRGFTGSVNLFFDATINGGWSGVLIALATEGIRFHKIWGTRGGIAGGSSVFNTFHFGLVAKIISETVNLTESIVRRISFRKIIREVFSLPDTHIRRRTMMRLKNETTQITEVRPSFAQKRLQYIAEALNLSDASGWTHVFSKIVGETINITWHVTQKKQEWMDAANSAVWGDPMWGDPMWGDSGQGVAPVYVRLADETLQLSDLLGKFRSVPKFISETINITDSLFETMVLLIVKLIAETVNITEATLRLHSKMINDIINLIETTYRPRTLRPHNNETMRISTTMPWRAWRARVIEETTFVIDSIQYISWIWVFANETMQLTEAFIKRMTLRKLLKDWIYLSETRYTQRSIRRILAETVRLIETRRPYQVLKRVLTEMINISELIKGGITGVYSVVESFSISDALLATRSRFARIAEALNITEVTLRMRSLRRVLGETERVMDALVRSRVMRRILGATLNISETVRKATGFVRVLAEAIDVSEIVTRSWVLMIAEIVRLTESIVRTRVIRRIIVETERITDFRRLIRVRVISEVVRFLDTIGYMRQYPKSINETIQLQELVARTAIHFINEVMHTVEIIVRSRSMKRLIAETERVQDRFKLIRGRVVNEAANLSDNVRHRITMMRYGNDTVNLTEFLTKSRIWVFAETVRIIDGIIASRVLRRVRSEAIRIAETYRKIRVRWISTETINMSEATKIQNVIRRYANETLQLVENIARTAIHYINETERLLDASARPRVMRRRQSDTVNISETRRPYRLRVRSLLETVRVSEVIDYMKQYPKILNDTLNVTDAMAQFVLIWVRVVTETMNVSEVIAYRLWEYAPLLYARLRTLYKGQ